MKLLSPTLLFICGVATFLVGLIVPQRLTHGTTITAVPAGHEQPIAGSTYVNGYNLINIGGCHFADAYNAEALILGQPVAAFDGRGLSFDLLRLTCNPSDQNPVMRIDNLGLQALVLAGKTPAPGSTADPVVAQFLQHSADAGLDPHSVWGRVVSPSLCDRGTCSQYLDNVRLDFRPKTPASL